MQGSRLKKNIANEIKDTFSLQNNLFVIFLFCGMDFWDIRPNGHEKII